MELHQPVINFQLPDLQGQIHSLDEYRGRIIVINFWSCECPHSARSDGLIVEYLGELGGQVALLSIAANQNESVQSMKEAARSRSIPTVLIDAGHVVADLFKAVTTPHVFVVDQDGVLRYRGAVDDVTFRRRTASRFFLKEVVGALLEGHLPALTETSAYGCTIVREI